MISEELLSLVLGEKIQHVICHRKDNHIVTSGNNEKLNLINLDTLGRLYKEWCGKQGYVLFSDCYGTLDIYLHGATYPIDKKITSKLWDITELKAIIKATEWVAKEKGLL